MAMLNPITVSAQNFAIGFALAVSGSPGSSPLAVAYVHNTSGAAIALRWMARTAQPIDKLWLFVDAVTGSPTLECTIYNERTNEIGRPGATARDVSTATSAIGVDNWVEFTFGTPYTPAVGEILWFVVYNTHGTPASNSCEIRSATPLDIQGSTQATGFYTSTTGFSTSGSLLSELPHMVKQGSFYFGQPFTTQISTYFPSSTRERGIKFTAPMTFSVSQIHLFASVNIADVKIYDGAENPGGTTLAVYDMDSDPNETLNDQIGCKVFDTEFEFEQGEDYIVTFTLTGNTQSPGVLQIEDYSRFASDFDALRDACPWLPVGVLANVGGTAFDVDKAIHPQIRLPVSSFPTESPGGGGLLRHPGMAGGFVA